VAIASTLQSGRWMGDPVALRVRTGHAPLVELQQRNIPLYF